MSNKVEKVAEKTRIERLAICRRCPYADKKILGGTHCILCGCNVRAKTSWKNISCPDGKW